MNPAAEAMSPSSGLAFARVMRNRASANRARFCVYSLVFFT